MSSTALRDTREGIVQQIHQGYRKEIPWREAYGEFVDVHTFIPDVSAEQVWQYLSDIRNISDWTTSIRNIQSMSDLAGKKRYIADNPMSPGGKIYMLESLHPETRTADWWIGHSPEDIWMHYCMRVLDGARFLGRQGAILIWTNFSHANFARDPLLQRGFAVMAAAHTIERENLIKVLRHRAAGNAGSLDSAAQKALGLRTISTMTPEELWSFIESTVRPAVTWNELYHDFAGTHVFIPKAKATDVFACLADPNCFSNWHIGLTNVEARRNGYFFAQDSFTPLVQVGGQVECHPERLTLDVAMAPIGFGWIQSNGVSAFTSHFRVLDGQDSMGRDGAVVIWVSFRHAEYDRSPGLSDYWTHLPIRQWMSLERLRAGFAK